MIRLWSSTQPRPCGNKSHGPKLLESARARVKRCQFDSRDPGNETPLDNTEVGDMNMTGVTSRAQAGGAQCHRACTTLRLAPCPNLIGRWRKMVVTYTNPNIT